MFIPPELSNDWHGEADEQALILSKSFQPVCMMVAGEQVQLLTWLRVAGLEWSQLGTTP